jgi:hypothetical protein
MKSSRNCGGGDGAAARSGIEPGQADSGAGAGMILQEDGTGGFELEDGSGVIIEE